MALNVCVCALWAIKYSVYVAHCKWHPGLMCAHTETAMWRRRAHSRKTHTANNPIHNSMREMNAYKRDLGA